MELGFGYWGPIVATAVMLLGTILAYVLCRVGRKIEAPKPSAEKLKTYACGEELKPAEVHMDSEQFFSPVRRVLRPFYRYVQPAHTGVVSTYLLWVIVGLVAIFIAILALVMR
ncbi:MAG: hypothetical protein NZ934_03220 [Hadesarchaea archaeon]|nr:hypothetical protein [Hadesarchaea archaeon]